MKIFSGGQTGADRGGLDAASPRESKAPGIQRAVRDAVVALFGRRFP